MLKIAVVTLALVVFGIATMRFSHAGNARVSGMASYYGSESGSHTASGARFRPGGLTAAHRHLPFGTRLRCEHRGRTVEVIVNDRGPFIRGRVLDLSRGAAVAIGLIGAGVGHVECEEF